MRIINKGRDLLLSIICMSFCTIHVLSALEDTLTITSDPSPNYLDNIGRYYPKETSNLDTYMARGDTRIMYLRVTRPGRNGRPRDTYTAVFFPKVDDYSSLVVPNSWPLLDADNNPGASVNVSLIFYYSGRALEIPWRQHSTQYFGWTYYVPGRTVLIKLNQGRIESYGWASTRCVLTACRCLDNTCAETCFPRNCNITIRVAWAGTDRNNLPLRSYDRDIWRLKNTFS